MEKNPQRTMGTGCLVCTQGCIYNTEYVDACWFSSCSATRNYFRTPGPVYFAARSLIRSQLSGQVRVRGVNDDESLSPVPLRKIPTHGTSRSAQGWYDGASDVIHHIEFCSLDSSGTSGEDCLLLENVSYSLHTRLHTFEDYRYFTGNWGLTYIVICK